MPLSLTSWLGVVAGGLLIFAIWFATRTRWPIKVTVDEDGVAHQGVAGGQATRIRKFLRNDVAISGKVVILARREPNGALRIRIVGDIDSGTRQQIRNFLVSEIWVQ